MNSEIESKINIIEDQKEKLKISKEENDVNVQKLVQFETEIDQLKMKISDIKEDWNKEIDRYNDNDRSKESSIKELKLQINKLERNNYDLNEEIKILNSDKNIFKTKYNHIKVKISSQLLDENIEHFKPKKELIENREIRMENLKFNTCNEERYDKFKTAREDQQTDLREANRSYKMKVFRQVK